MFKPFVARWRSFGIFAIVYIDDGIFACRSLLDAQSASKLVRSDLPLSGWKSNEKKSNWEPRQLWEWLEIIVDTIRMLFINPAKKIVKLTSVLTGLIDEFPQPSCYGRCSCFWICDFPYCCVGAYCQIIY